MADDSISQEELDQVLNQDGDAVEQLADQVDSPDQTGSDASPEPAASNEAQVEVQAATDQVETDQSVPQSVELPDLVESPGGADQNLNDIGLLNDVELNVKIELGRSKMLIDDVLQLGPGSVVELDKLAGDPVDVFVNERLVARGEVLVLNDSFCVRVNQIVSETTGE